MAGTVGALRCERTVRVGRALPDLSALSAGRHRVDGSLVLLNETVTLCLPREMAGFTHGVLFVRDGERLRRLGVIPHLGKVQAAGGIAELVATDAEEVADGFRLSGSTVIGEVTWRFVTRFQLRPGTRHIAMTVRVVPERASSLSVFHGPAFLAGDGSFGARKNTALLPGLEYLEGEERSSDAVGVIPPYHGRWTPHPYKITVPLMAVAAEGLCAAVFWDPLQRYDGEHACPAVRFASPNRRPCPEGPPAMEQDNHLLAVFAPGILAGLPENGAYLDAFLVTGEARFLKRSRYWAMTGLPFIYLWRAPDREVMPYASISVMGTTFWTLQWFGTPVQWVGLVYARAIQRLSRFDDSVDWRRLAEGILLSAMQQEMDRVEEPRSRLGFLTDNVNVVTREVCQWYISPTHVDRALGAVTGSGPWIHTEVVRCPGGTVHITSPGQVDSAVFEAGALRFRLTGQQGLAYRTVVVGLTAPAGVRVDDVALTAATGPGLQPGQFFHDEQTGSLVLATRQTAEHSVVTVLGAEARRREAATPGDSLVNGGFERGRFGWEGAPGQAVTIVGDCHGGSKSVLLDARGVEPEVQCSSSPFRVEGGKRYRLASHVKSLAGNGGFKVTVEWLGPSHIRYDNDWKGTGAPLDWSLHGAVFTAPAGATTARIILGCRRGSAYLFDDIALEEAGE